MMKASCSRRPRSRSRIWHGYGNIIPGLEKALGGAEPGHEEEIVVEPDQAYEECDPSPAVSVPPETIPEDTKLESGCV
jgi:FKBP-type peptidyl-prolyl cis-trans isomerase SlyD